jgi:hypothetical protein
MTIAEALSAKHDDELRLAVAAAAPKVFAIRDFRPTGKLQIIDARDKDCAGPAATFDPVTSRDACVALLAEMRDKEQSDFGREIFSVLWPTCNRLVYTVELAVDWLTALVAADARQVCVAYLLVRNHQFT